MNEFKSIKKNTNKSSFVDFNDVDTILRDCCLHIPLIEQQFPAAQCLNRWKRPRNWQPTKSFSGKIVAGIRS